MGALFHPSLSWVNQGGELKLTFFFGPFLSPSWFIFANFFFLTSHACPRHIYLPTFRLLAYAPWPLPYLPAHLPTHLHQGKDYAC